MAATKRNAMLIAEARDKIRTTQLINRLTNHALSEAPIMDASQVRAIEILLRKVLPDLASGDVEHSGAIGLAAVDRPPNETREEWIARQQRALLLGSPAGTAD